MARKGQNIDYNLLISAGLIVGVFIAGRKILENFGLISTKQEQNALQQLIIDNYFNPNYWKQEPGALIITESYSRQLAEIIYDSYGYFNDDESAVYGVFELMKTKSQVSWLSMKFQQYYNKSLLEYLRSFLNNEELAKIAMIVNKLPKFKA